MVILITGHKKNYNHLPGVKIILRVTRKISYNIKFFFIAPMSIVWFYFLQSQFKIVCDTVTKIEEVKISACKVAKEFGKNLKHKKIKIILDSI